MPEMPTREQVQHVLKTWPQFYEYVESGVKGFELRKNDRQFAVGDTLILREFDPNSGKYTGRECRRVIDYITDFPEALQDGYVCMGISDPDLSMDKVLADDDAADSARWRDTLAEVERLRQRVAELERERAECECCGEPATRQSADGVPLCEGDYLELIRQASPDTEPAGGGDATPEQEPTTGVRAQLARYGITLTSTPAADFDPTLEQEQPK